MSDGILDHSINETPISVLDFETTGLSPGGDRVVEISVVRKDPGQAPRLIFDTLVNPNRRVSGTDIHGITDDDVKDAPQFQDIAGNLIEALSGSVVSAYNVYFDLRFLQHELQQSGVTAIPPHLCLMYLRPMLGLGNKCKLDQACEAHSIDLTGSHIASNDAIASAALLEQYLQEMDNQKIKTFRELAELKKYKFVKSWTNPHLPEAHTFGLTTASTIHSRSPHAPVTSTQTTTQAAPPAPTKDPETLAIRSYWDTLRTVITDLPITEEEIDLVLQERSRLQLSKERIRYLHAKAFHSVLTKFIDDKIIDDKEAHQLQRLLTGLSTIGWAPGD